MRTPSPVSLCILLSALLWPPTLVAQTPPAPTKPEAKAAPEAPAPKPAGKGSVDFATQVWPIFEKSCVECHATAHTGADGKQKRPKGGVVLDSKEGITGSKKGKLVVAKKPDDSLLYQSITLAADDEDRMPPPKKGDPLPKEKVELIKRWIEEGAELGKWTGTKAEAPKAEEPGKGKGDKPAGAPATKPADKPKGVDPLVRLQQDVKPLPAATLAAFAGGPFQVASVGDGSPLLQVSCLGNNDAVDDRAVAQLAPIASHVVHLDLGRTRVGDAACTTIATMPRLVQLDLRQTQVGNQGVAALAGCKELRSLNLFGTKTGDYALTALTACKHLEQLYLWQTEASAAAVVRLREGLPGLRVVMANELPEAMAEGQGQARRRR